MTEQETLNLNFSFIVKLQAKQCKLFLHTKNCFNYLTNLNHKTTQKWSNCNYSHLLSDLFKGIRGATENIK